MGCASSKDAVQEITVDERGVVKPASGKARKIRVNGTESLQLKEENAVRVSSAKATSAKSRDSGIDGMDNQFFPGDGIITEESDPHLVASIENDRLPNSADLSLIGHPIGGATPARERLKSKAILEELESQGLISGSKVHKGGAAFEVTALPPTSLEPLGPPRAPARLEKLKQDKPALTKEELEKKMQEAEIRRQKSLSKPKKRSRLASQLAKDREMASNIQSNADDDSGSDLYDESKYTNPFKSTNEIPHE